jgi:hypothetical protein
MSKLVHAGRDKLFALRAATAKLPKADIRAIIEPIIDGLLFLLDPDTGSGACNLRCVLQRLAVSGPDWLMQMQSFKQPQSWRPSWACSTSATSALPLWVHATATMGWMAFLTVKIASLAFIRSSVASAKLVLP